MKLIENLGMIYLKESSKQKTSMAIYECPICHKPTRARPHDVKKKIVKNCKSCGQTTHGQAKPGRVSANYARWGRIKDRCSNNSHPKYKDYGARGITMCKEWRESFPAFDAYISSLENYKKEGYSIDRIDNNKGYQPGNVRWADRETQSQNTRVLYTHNTTGFRGVQPTKNNTFVVVVNANKKQVYLGRFRTAIEGAKAYDKYVIENGFKHNINGV